MPFTSNFYFISFSPTLESWPQGISPATPLNKMSATAFVNGLSPAGSFCLDAAVIEALDVAHSAQGTSAVILFTDNVANCQPSLASIMAANPGGVAVHCIHLTLPFDTAFLEALAAATGGAFTSLGHFQMRRGDFDDSGDVALPDAIGLLQYLFASGVPPSCPQAADANANDHVNIDDVLTILVDLFGSGNPGPPLGTHCDSTAAGSLGFCTSSTCP